MMHARFYIYRADLIPHLQQALGSDSIVYMSDNLTPQGRHNVVLRQAERLNRKDGLNKGYVGYAIFTGQNVMNCTPRYTEIFPTSVEYIELCRDQKVTI